MLSKFIAGLSPLGKILLIGASVFGIIALFDLLFFAPIMSRMDHIDEEIVKEKNSIKQDLHFLGYKDKISKESQAIEPYLTEQLGTDEEMIAAFLKKIEMLAKTSNINLAKVTPVPGTQEKDYLKYQADLECSGKLADVIAFMHLIDTSDDLMKVVKFSFANKKSDSDDLKAVMTIDKVIVTNRAVALPPKSQAAADNSGEMAASGRSSSADR